MNYESKLKALAKEIGRDISDVTECWNERAAVIEYDGGIHKDEAERLAFEDTVIMLTPMSWERLAVTYWVKDEDF